VISQKKNKEKSNICEQQQAIKIKKNRLNTSHTTIMCN